MASSVEFSSEQCSICCVRKDIAKKPLSKFSSKLKKEVVTIDEAICAVYGKFPGPHEVNKSGLWICTTCCGELRKVYNAYNTLSVQKDIFKTSIAQNSFLQSWIHPVQSPQIAHAQSSSTPSTSMSVGADIPMIRGTSDSSARSEKQSGTPTSLKSVESGSQTERTESTEKKKIKKTPIGKKMMVARHQVRRQSAFFGTIRKIVHGEVSTLVKSSVLREPVTRDEALPADTIILDELKELAPTLSACIKGAMFRKGTTKITFQPVMAAIVGILLNARTKTCNRLQQAIGLILWRTKASEKTYRILNNLGICCSYKSINTLLDTLRENYDYKVKNWKSTVSDLLTQPHLGGDVNVEEYMDLDSDDGELGVPAAKGDSSKKRIASKSPVKGKMRVSKKKFQRRLDLEYSERTDEDFYGLSFTFDNLNKHIIRGSSSSIDRNKMLNLVSAVAVFNRVPMKITSALGDAQRLLAVDLAITSFLPTSNELNEIRNDHLNIVKRILVKHVPIFKRIEKLVKWHLPHEFSSYSSQRSETVNLGLFNYDENTTEGMIEIMTKLQTYLPERENKKLFGAVCWGDGLTADRVRSTQQLRLNARTEVGKLNGLFPGVSHWHKRVILLEDDMKCLMKSYELHFGKGSLPHLKALFSHSQAGLEMKTKFNPTTDFLKFVLNGYCIALCNTELIQDGSDKDNPELSDVETEILLNKIAEKIVRFEWHDIGKSISQTEYCLCRRIYDPTETKDWIGCDNQECQEFSWYHKSCLVERRKSAQLAGEECKYNGPPRRTKDRWYCCDECKKNCEDSVVLYSKALMFSALNHECYRDAIRENSGLKMKIYSKMHLIQLWNKGHTNYFRICHRVLAMLGGCSPPHIQHDLLWNSTVNILGAAGKNIEMDLFNEFVNKFLKDHVLLNYGNYKDKTMERRSQAFDISTEIRANLLMYLTGTDLSSGHTKARNNWEKDLPKCVDVLINNQVFTKLGHRHHDGFENFCYDHVYVDNIETFKAAVQEKSRLIDAMERCWKRKLEPLADHNYFK